MQRHMIFHCFPKLGANWQENCLSTFQYREAFNGRIIISIVYGPDCAPIGEVMEWFDQFGLDIEFRTALNVTAMGINTTFRNQVQSIRREPGIVFKAHTKGVSHVGDKFGPWRNNMAKGCLSNVALVEQKFNAGFRTFGVYKTFSEDGARVMDQNWTGNPRKLTRARRRTGIVRPTWQGWHYPGAFFWFDPQFIPDTFFTNPMHHYENEAFPCYLGPVETGFALKPNNLLFASANIAPFFKELQEPLCEKELTAAVAAGHL